MRSWVVAGGAAALIAGPTALAFFSGGFFDRPRVIAAMAAWTLVGAAVVFAPRPLPTSTAGRLALTGLALLTAWTALSISWAPIAGRAIDDLQRLLLYLGAFTAALALLRGAGARRWLEPALAAGALIVVLYGLSERLLPGLVELDRSFSSAGRLEQPITYWNAFGLLAAMGFVLAVRLAGDPERERGMRAAAAMAGVPLGLGIYLTFARGALAAVAAGLLVLIALAPAARPQLRSVLAIGGASALAALLANRYDTVKSLEQGVQGDSGEGLQMLAALLLLGAAAAALVMRRPRRELTAPAVPVSRAAAVFAVAGVLLMGGVLAAAVFEGKPETVSPARGAGPERLGSIDTNRYRYWEVALESWADRPLTGLGSGGFVVEWLKERDRVDTSGDAHSLYLETAAELGVVGLAFLLVFGAGVCLGVVRLHRLDPRAASGPAAVVAAWAVHVGLDWDWEMPAVSLVALLAAAAAIAWSEERASVPQRAERARRSARNVPMRATTGPLALLLALALVLPAAALGQSAGDEQYVDPFQQPNSGQGGGSNGGDSQGEAPAPAPAPEAVPAPPAEPPAGTGAVDPAIAQGTATDGSQTLPRTGLGLATLIVGGLGMLGGGAALRRFTLSNRRPS